MVNDDDSLKDAEKEDRALVERVLRELYCRFDTVQIFVSRLEPEDKTLGYADGRGNSYAIKGQVQEWLENGGAMHVEIGFELDDEDDDETWEPVEE